MLKYLPFIAAGLIIAPVTYYQWSLMDWVWKENIPAQQCAYLLETEIPREIGDWVGVDRVVDAKVLETAGADGYIDRLYTNTKTNEQVSVWLIVGHFRDVSRHTPNICYRGAGFEQTEKARIQPIEVQDLPASHKFRTTKFMAHKPAGDIYQRVFWAWWKPEPLEEGQSSDDVNIAWTSPEDPRLDFGYCRALYKLYFTANTNADEQADESVCLKFATEFLPVVDEKLRESGVVMAQEELPEDAAQVLKRMRDANEGTSTEPASDEGADETTPEASTDEA